MFLHNLIFTFLALQQQIPKKQKPSPALLNTGNLKKNLEATSAILNVDENATTVVKTTGIETV